MAENNTVISFFDECMCPWENGIINSHCTTGRIYRVYQAWCRENNNGFAKTAREFRSELASHLGSAFKEISLHTRTGTYYRKFTLTQEMMIYYRKSFDFYGVCENDFPEDFLA